MMIQRTRKTVVGGHKSGYFALCWETTLKVMVGNSGPWTPKTASFRRRHWPVSDRLGGFDIQVFPALWLAGCTLAACTICPAQQPLQHQRIFDGSALSADLGPRKNRDHRTAALQRGLSLLGGLAGLPAGQQLAALPGATGSRRTQRFAQVARPLACGNDRPPSANHLRLGQYRAHRVRPSGTSRGGLQPQEARTPLLSSAAVLRRTDAGLLGGKLPLRQRGRFDRYRSAAGARFCQAAETDPASPRARRRRLLRSQNHRI